MNLPLQERYIGCLVGLAVGDAIGTAVEFKKPGTFTPVTDMTGGGPFHLRPGQWTDDTSLALCLATSIIETQEFNPTDQMQRYLRWWREGYLSSTGRCFDIGGTTSNALGDFEQTGNPFSGSEDPKSAGNGSIMRLAPVPMWLRSSIEKAIEFSGESSRTTHAARTTIDACRYLGAIIVGLLNGMEKEEILSPTYEPSPGYWNANPLCEEIERIRMGSYKEKTPKDLRSGGYVVETMEAAFSGFFRSTSFANGCLEVVNLGNDADTAAAVYGQIAGAYYGIKSIPEHWVNNLVMKDEIIHLAKKLMEGPTKI